MTTLGQAHRHAPVPDWQVQSVFDPDGGGLDFAYTIGLHDRGLPELHIWARPPLGDDPGEDWVLSVRDRTVILNEVAWRLIDGDLEVGSEWETTYDDGLVTARFRLDPPGDRDELEALGIAPGAEVLPVRWSLHRPPVGPARQLGPRDLRRATSEYAGIVDKLHGLGDPAELPEGWVLAPTFTPGGEFGPLSPMVTARVAEFWSADAITLSNLNWAGITAHLGGVLTWPATVAAAVARRLGRVDEVARGAAAAEELVERRMRRPDWPETARRLTAAIGFEPGEATPEEVEHGVRHTLTELLRAVLTTEIVVDGLTSAQRLAGRGAWLTGLGPVGDLPGPQWRAPKRVIDRLAALLAPLPPPTLLEIARRHLDEELEDYAMVSSRVHGWALIAPAGCPWRGVLDRLPGCLALRRPLELTHLVHPESKSSLSTVPFVDGLQEWATVMTSACCHRERLAPAEIAALTAPFLDLVPDLPGLISG